MKDISEYAVTIRASAIKAWEAFRNGDKAQAYKHYSAIQIAAREAADQCAEGYPELPKGWPYPSPSVDAGYEKRAVEQGLVTKPVFDENR